MIKRVFAKLYQCKSCLGWYDKNLKKCPYCGNVR